MARNFVYVDFSNVLIEGRKVSAVAKGLAPDLRTADSHCIHDYDWSLDFGRLLWNYAGGPMLGRAVLYASLHPQDDGRWARRAQEMGFEVVLHKRNAWGREKMVDTHLTVDMINDSWERMDRMNDWITLVAGDEDYVPAVEHLEKRNIRVDVVFWEHAARELKGVCSNFYPLNPALRFLDYSQRATA